ncbi:MAG TPA: DUF1850 domain-containing protein [Planococcus sp. (in: firmicutes)]|nr:DUF1850 domain-containing protein [Planococcus sp. (in: firmicutes)]
MSSKKWKWGACFIVLLFFLFIRLPVIVFDFGAEVYLLKEDSFALEWIHSVEKEEWIEFYERDGENLLLTETVFKTFGAGVPSDGEIIPSDDGFIHMRIDRRLPEMNLTVSENAATAIQTEKKKVLLYELAEDYEMVSISVQFVHLWEYIGGKEL